MPVVYRFRVYQRPDGAFHITGYDRSTASAHISPPLVSFDGQAGIGRTADGIEYVLSSYPALDMHVGWCWEEYRAANDLPRCADVTPREPFVER